MNLEFEWDDDKAAANEKKHKVRFEEAATVFADPLAVIFDDEQHSGGSNARSSLAIPWRISFSW